MSVKRSNIFIGKTGECIAESFLRQNKYKVLERNYKTPFGEIDLIVLDNGTIVFVEVKTRTQDDFGPPQVSVTDQKSSHILKNAAYYLKKRHCTDEYCRIDVIAINLSPTGGFERLEHIKNAVCENTDHLYNGGYHARKSFFRKRYRR